MSEIITYSQNVAIMPALIFYEKSIFAEAMNKPTEQSTGEDACEQGASPEESWAKRIDMLFSTAKLALPIASAIGLIVVIGYLVGVIHFFPKGLTVGDSLLFIVTALSFGFIYLFFVACGAATAYLSVSAWRAYKTGQWLEASFDFLGALVFGLFLILISFFSRDFFNLFALLAAGILISFATQFWRGYDDLSPERRMNISRRERSLSRLVMIATAIALPGLVGSIGTVALGSTMNTIGLSRRSATISIKGDEFLFLQSLAQRHDLPVFGCPSKGESDHLIHDVNVLWHGVGERSLLSFEAGIQDADGQESIFGYLKNALMVEVPSESILISRMARPVDRIGMPSCAHYTLETAFANGEFDLNAAQQTEIKRYLDGRNVGWSPNKQRRLASIIVRGYADMSPSSRNDGNADLSEKRAKTAAAFVRERLDGMALGAVRVTPIGMGVRNSLSKCEADMSGLAARECRTIDRRVELELVYEVVQAIATTVAKNSSDTAVENK